ncbi:DUF6182 family protein [Sphaerisporangium aureirubrum]|uniref:DUF6182 family protein n=1 Tax=Sphaerisporangium aureirubrum TaxID=1544736 RepID=A0ABW1NSL2_9ACTN
MTVVHEECQALLRRLRDERLTACTSGLPAVPDLSVIVVLSALDPAAFVTGALRFVTGLDRRQADTWMRTYTRTVFLAGNPANLRERFAFQHVSPDGRLAWTAPGDPAAHVGLRRLLRAFSGTTPPGLPGLVDLDVPGGPPTGTAHRLYVPATGSVDRYLVDVHHTLAEAVLRGILRPGDRLRLRHVTGIEELTGLPEYARVVAAADAGDHLRPATWLTREETASVPSPSVRSAHPQGADPARGTAPAHARKGRAA